MLNSRGVELEGGVDIFLDFISGGVGTTRPTGKIATTLKEVEELMIPPDGVK